MPRARSHSTLRLTRLELDNWKNFAHVGIDLQERVFVVGPNASGKSNLLDALRFLRDLAASDGGLQGAVSRRDGVSAIRCLAARRDPDVGVKVTLGTSEAPATWSYQLRFSHDRDLAAPVISLERVEHDGEELLVRPDDDDRRDPNA